MIDAEKLLGGLLRQSLGGGRRGRRRKKSGLGSLVGPGMTGAAGMGLLGVAIAAFEHYSGKQSPSGSGSMPPGSPPAPAGSSGRPAMPPPPPPPGSASSSPVPPAPPAGPQAKPHLDASQAVLLIQSMVAAANADGEIDSDEEKAILDYLEEGKLNTEEREFIHQLIASPPSIDSLIPKVTDEEGARQVYAVSELAIEVDTQAERDYLDYLKKRLGLSG